MKSNQVTIKDIARELNISPSTVSRALKDHPDISPETKKIVNDLARELNYQPNAIALSLRGGKTNTIGIIIPEIVHFFFSTIISGIEEVAYSAGYNVIICQTNESYLREVTDTNALLSSKVDGMLVSISRETKNFDHLKKVRDSGIPIVFFDRFCDELNTSRVIVNDYDGAFHAVEHLIEQGCKRIAHFEGPTNLLISKNRLEGYHAALKKHGMETSPSLIRTCPNGSQEEAFELMTDMLESHDPPDAVFCHSDLSAFGVMQATKKKGLKIPQDVAVVGFSNWQFSSFVEPPLSTVIQPGFEMGMIAAELLLNELNAKDNEFDHVTRKLKAELVIRDSSRRIPVGV
jgi:LacI family transcriptional regulator